MKTSHNRVKPTVQPMPGWKVVYTDRDFPAGTAVTNDKDQHGVIQWIEVPPKPREERVNLYWVYWEHRANHPDRLVARHPTTPHRKEQIRALHPSTPKLDTQT